jgi:hypothetical protein
LGTLDDAIDLLFAEMGDRMVIMIEDLAVGMDTADPFRADVFVGPFQHCLSA